MKQERILDLFFLQFKFYVTFSLTTQNHVANFCDKQMNFKSCKLLYQHETGGLDLLSTNQQKCLGTDALLHLLGMRDKAVFSFQREQRPGLRK